MKQWLQIIFETSAADADAVSELLPELGALAVSLQDSADTPIYEPRPGAKDLWTQTRIIALFDPGTRVDDISGQISARLDLASPPICHVSHLADQDWERVWIDEFKPLQFGKRLWICPSHCPPPDPSAINIMLDPGLAFGTGTHETTALCLEWLDQQALSGLEIIDYGCGSGILAIAAAMLGAKHVWATDIDEQALLATTENALRNKVDGVISVATPDGLPVIEADCILANILANPLCQLAANFSAMLKPGGYLVLSGILDEQAETVANAYRKWFDIERQTNRGGWIRIDARRHA